LGAILTKRGTGKSQQYHPRYDAALDELPDALGKNQVHPFAPPSFKFDYKT
jgi:hypothetical protein